MSYYRDNEQHLIENYELAKADNFKGWDLHHRLELTLDGEPALKYKDLIRMGMYFNRPYFELIYLRKKDHYRLHFLGTHIPDHIKQRISNTLKGVPKPEGFGNIVRTRMKGQSKSETWRKHLSDSLKGLRKGIPLSEHNKEMKARAQREIGYKYREYKASGGTMTYNEFRSSIKKSRQI